MSKNTIQSKNEGWFSGSEGQLAIDVYETKADVIIKAPIAGVRLDDLEISVTDEIINIKGERKQIEEIIEGKYHAQECYWGAFSRSFNLPAAVITEKTEATIKDGILVIKMPKK